MSGVVQAWIDADDRFTVADPWLAALQRRAGGGVPGPICLPQIASIAQLARRIDGPVRRRLIVADGATDLLLDAEARVDGALVSLSIVQWREQPSHEPGEPQAASAPDSGRYEGEDDGLLPALDRAVRPALSRILADAHGLLAEGGGTLAAQQIGYAEDILSASRHLEAMLDKAGDFEELDGPDFTVRSTAIDLSRIAREAMAMALPRSIEGGCEIVASDMEEPCLALGDHQGALQIVGNLIGNAVRHAPAGSMVLIGTTLSGHFARLWVSDRGRGIDPADQIRIFEKYQRVDPEEPGSGLGLYIARGLAEAMGGDITVESTPGNGAIFTLSLPRP